MLYLPIMLQQRYVEVLVGETPVEFEYQLALDRRKKSDATLLYFHGIGCSMGDFLPPDASPLRNYTQVSFNFPGCGGSEYPVDTALTLGDVADGAQEILEAENKHREKTIVVGHSIGGLVGLLYALRHPDTVEAFISVEGNLTANDCFLTRDLATGGSTALAALQEKCATSDNRGFKRFAQLLRVADQQAIQDYARSTVNLCDEASMLGSLCGLEIPRLFMYGEENGAVKSPGTIDYLPTLKAGGVDLAEIAGSNHFPQFERPVAFYTAVADFAITNNL